MRMLLVTVLFVGACVMTNAIDPVSLMAHLFGHPKFTGSNIAHHFRSHFLDDSSCTQIHKFVGGVCKETCVPHEVAGYGFDNDKTLIGPCKNAGFNNLVRSYERPNPLGGDAIKVDVYERPAVILGGSKSDQPELEDLTEMIDLVSSLTGPSLGGRKNTNPLRSMFSSKSMFSHSKFLGKNEPSIVLSVTVEDDGDDNLHMGMEALPFLLSNHRMADAQPTIMSIDLSDSDSPSFMEDIADSAEPSFFVIEESPVEDDHMAVAEEPEAEEHKLSEKEEKKAAKAARRAAKKAAKEAKRAEKKAEKELKREEAKQLAEQKHEVKKAEEAHSSGIEVAKEAVYATPEESTKEFVPSLPKLEDYENLVLPKALQDKVDEGKKVKEAAEGSQTKAWQLGGEEAMEKTKINHIVEM
eukprot:Platyproteum_vivax@DN651_c0_g1_i1.p1